MANKIYYKGKGYGGDDLPKVEGEENSLIINDGNGWIKSSIVFSLEELEDLKIFLSNGIQSISEEYISSLK